MNVYKMLNGPVSLHIWLISLFQMKFHAHLPWNVPRIVASSQYIAIREISQNIGRWAWYQIANSKMSVRLKLNGSLLFELLLIFLFQFWYLLIFFQCTQNIAGSSLLITIWEITQNIGRWAWYQFEKGRWVWSWNSKDRCCSIFGSCSSFKAALMPILHTVHQTYYWSLLDCYVGMTQYSG